MPGPLEPPDWTDADYGLGPEYFKQEPSKKPLIISPEEAERKYTDPDLIARVVRYVDKRTAEQSYEISEIRKTLEDIQSKITYLDSEIRRIFPPEKEEEIISKEEPPMLLNKVTREEWGAIENDSVHKMELMTLPIKKVHLTYSTKTKNSDNSDDVIEIIKNIQAKHINSGLLDISHNFLIGGDGQVYEGRGWYLKPEIASKNPDWSDSTIDVAFIGDYERETFPYELLEFTDDLMKLGIRSNVVSKDYKILFE